MDGNEIAVFDFDGTLISKDTGYEFNKWLIQQSLIRTSLMILFFPLLLLLASQAMTRRLGLNIGCFLATAFQRRSLFKLRDDFIHYYFNEAGAVAYQAGLDELRGHQKKGTAILIVSGCPHWLLHAVVKYLDIHPEKIIGSHMEIKYGSVLLKEHCYHNNKLIMAKRLGIDLNQWAIGYSDSKADMPLLSACLTKVLVNIPLRKQQIFKNSLNGNIEMRTWT